MGKMSSDENSKKVHDSMAPSLSPLPVAGGSNSDEKAYRVANTCQDATCVSGPLCPPNGSYSSQREALQEEVKRSVPLGDIEGSPSVGNGRKQLRGESEKGAQSPPHGGNFGIRERFLKAVSFGTDPIIREISFRTKEEAEASFLSPAEYFFIKRRAKAQAEKRRKSGILVHDKNKCINSRDNGDAEEATRGLDMVDDELLQHRNRKHKNALAVVMEHQQKDTPPPPPPGNFGGVIECDDSYVVASKDEDISERIAQAYREQTRNCAESAIRQAESDAKEVDSYLADTREKLGIGAKRGKNRHFGRIRRTRKGIRDEIVENDRAGGRLKLRFKFPNMLRRRTRSSTV